MEGHTEHARLHSLETQKVKECRGQEGHPGEKQSVESSENLAQMVGVRIGNNTPAKVHEMQFKQDY